MREPHAVLFFMLARAGWQAHRRSIFLTPISTKLLQDDVTQFAWKICRHSVDNPSVSGTVVQSKALRFTMESAKE